MTALGALRPKQKLRVMDLLSVTGLDVSDWKNYKGKNAASNPKYCYNWSFEQSGEFVVVCLWHSNLSYENGKVVFQRKSEPPVRKGSGASVWSRREADFGRSLELAYRQQLPVRVIVLEGAQYDKVAGVTKASSVHARLLDPLPWAVSKYY